MSGRFKLRYASHLGIRGTHEPLFAATIGNLDPVDHIAFAAEQGFAGVEDNFFKTRDPIEQSRMGDAFARFGLELGCLLSSVVPNADWWIRDDAEARAAVDAEIACSIEAAKRGGGRYIVVAPPRENALVVSSDPDIAASADKFAELCDHAAGAPIRINLEFGPFAEISTFDQARAVLADVRQPEAGLLFDPYHLFRTGGALADVRSTAKEKLSYAQICDAIVGSDGLDLVDRALPGEGVLPLGDFLSALPPGIPLSVELRSPTLYAAEPDPLHRACRVAQATRAFLARHYSDT